jgi:Flavin-binding monooxygenase-like
VCQNILLIGAGVSSTDIARELGPVVAAVYQSSRGGDLDLPSSFLPPNAVRIGGIAKLDHPATLPPDELTSATPIPSTVTLADGSKLHHIHHVILCTGYMTSYPFLKQYHHGTLSAEHATPSTLVTADGTQVHNLHKDIFYIPDSTLAFIGTPYHTATFSLFEFQAMALARVFAGACALPTEHEMRAEYGEKRRRKGLSRDFHSLRGYGEEEAYVNELVEWVNRDAGGDGVGLMEGHSAEWLAANRAREEKLKWLRARRAKAG